MSTLARLSKGNYIMASNAFEQRKEQYQLIKSIREQLPAGYGASRWDDNIICVSYRIYGVQDNTERYFVSNEQEWQALKPTLGRHSTEMLALLKEYGERIGGNLSQWLVYGSEFRPMSASWARLDGAVFMQTDKVATGYHTYVAAPLSLSKEAMERYQLVFVSR